MLSKHYVFIAWGRAASCNLQCIQHRMFLIAPWDVWTHMNLWLVRSMTFIKRRKSSN